MRSIRLVCSSYNIITLLYLSFHLQNKFTIPVCNELMTILQTKLNGHNLLKYTRYYLQINVQAIFEMKNICLKKIMVKFIDT